MSEKTLLLSSDLCKALINIVSSSHDIENIEITIDNEASLTGGFIANIHRVTVTGSQKDGGATVSFPFICKLPSPDANIRAKFNAMKLFEREVFVYNEVLPEFEKIQKEFGILDSREGFYAYPKCYFAHFDSKTGETFLILEDLAQSDYVMDDSQDVNVSDVDKAKLLFDELGRFNAVSFAIRLHKPDVWEKFKSMDDILSTVMTTDIMLPIMANSRQLASSILAPHDVNGANLINSTSSFQVNELLKQAEPHAVVNHGDVWLNNMMFLYDSNKKLQQIKLFDFQMASIGSPIFDHSNYIFTCTDKSFRDAHFEELYRIYYTSFADLLRKLGGNPERQFPLSQVQMHVKLFGQFGLAKALYTVPCNCGYNPVNESGRSFNYYKKRMGDVIRDMLRIME